MTHVQIQTPGGHSIEGSLCLPASKQKHHPGVLFLHGWGGSRDRHYRGATLLARQGFVCLTVDLRGHGKTRELVQTVSASNNLADAIAAYDFLVSRQAIEYGHIGVAGFSYGGFLAILLSQHRTLQWLALRAPALYRDDDISTPKSCIDRKKLALFRRKKLTPEDSIALAACSRFKGDVLVLESENDSVVPHQQVQNFVDSFKEARSLTHVRISDADHSLSEERWKEFALDTLVHWFTRPD